LKEQAGYFAVPGADLFAVLHPVTEHEIDAFSFVGPFARK
jgi:hypothetical protein